MAASHSPFSCSTHGDAWLRGMLPLMRLGTITTGGKDVPINSDWRFSHTYIIGRSLMGKSTFLKRSALDDIYNDEGLIYFDFSGRDIQELLHYIPHDRREDCVLFDATDKEFPVGFNVLDGVTAEDKDRVANMVLDTFKDIYFSKGMSTPNVDLYVLTTLYALLEVPDSTLMGIYYMLASDSYRTRVVSQLKDSVVASFWTDFYASIPDKEVRVQTQSTLNKMFALIVDHTVRNIIGQVHNQLDFKDITDNRKILLVSLPQGQLGRHKAKLLGTLLLSQLHATLLTRSPDSPPFHIYLDNVHRFGTTTVIEMLDSLDGLNVSMTMAHRYIKQLDEDLQEAILGTVGTLIVYRIGVTDEERLLKEFPVNNSEKGLTELTPFTAHVKLPNHPDTKSGVFYGMDMPEHEHRPSPSSPAKIRAASRERYGCPRAHVEARIERFVGQMEAEPEPPVDRFKGIR